MATSELAMDEIVVPFTKMVEIWEVDESVVGNNDMVKIPNRSSMHQVPVQVLQVVLGSTVHIAIVAASGWLVATKSVVPVEVDASDVVVENEEVENVVHVYVHALDKMVKANRYGNVVPKQPVEKSAATSSTFVEDVNAV